MRDFTEVERALFSRGFALYPNGFQVVSQTLMHLADWRSRRIGDCVFVSHPEATVRVAITDVGGVVLVGNVVDPFSEFGQERVFETLTSLHGKSSGSDGLSEETIAYINQLTGRFRLFFVNGSRVIALSDAIALAPIYVYANDRSNLFSSHAQLLAELTGCRRDAEIQEFIDSPFYVIGRTHLPGYKTPFKEIEIVGANVYFDTRLGRRVRIFPREALDSGAIDFATLVDKACSILKKTASLYAKNRRVLLSLSMGQDSRINLSAYHDHRLRVEAYSYCGDPVETREAHEVKRLAGELGVTHHVISTDGITNAECEELMAVLSRTTAYMRKHKSTEIRKLIAMKRWFPHGALEVKGEASEVGRATYSKRTGVRRFPELDARAMSNLYKKVLFPRGMLRLIDGYFEEFKLKSAFGFKQLGYDDYDLFFWEHRNACCASLGMQDHDIYHDATALMNNRLLLKWFLTPCFADRLNDRLHRAVCEKLWPGILRTPTSRRHSPKARAKVVAENLFFRMNRF